MGLSWWHILLVLLVFVLLFGTGKISGLMGDVAKGIKSFKKGMAEDDDEAKAEPEPAPGAPEPKVIEHKTTGAAAGKAKSTARAKTPRTPKAS
jgi:sec-independent protein translocase protein TatA